MAVIYIDDDSHDSLSTAVIDCHLTAMTAMTA